MTTRTLNLPMLTGQLETGLSVVETAGLFPLVGGVTGSTIFALELPGMGRVCFMAILTGRTQPQIRSLQRAMLPFETPHIAGNNEIGLMTPLAIHGCVCPGEPKASAVVVELTLVEPHQFKVSSEMFFVTVCTVLSRYTCMEALPRAYPVLQGGVARQAFLIVDPLFAQRMARSAVADPLQIGMNL